MINMRLRGLLLVAFAIIGCSKGPTLPPLFPVKGKVTVNGQPVTSGQVSLMAISGGGEMSAGAIDGSGNYTIFTSGGEGAPSGKYKVTVTPSMVPQAGGGMPKQPFDSTYMDTQK